MPECECKFGIKVDKVCNEMWSFCIGISHMFSETYVFINVFRWSISIGWLMQYKNELNMS